MNFIQGIANYFRTSKAELEKVSWPTRRETIRYGALVVASTAILALFFAGLDLGLQKTVESLLIRNTTQQTTETEPVTPVTTSPAALPTVTPIEVQTQDGATVNIQASPEVK